MKARKNLIITTIILVGLGIVGFTRGGNLDRWWNGRTATEYDGKEEFKKLYNHYLGSGGDFDFSGIIYLYDVEDDNALKEQTVFRSLKAGENLFIQIGYQKNYLANSLLVQLDTLHKLISVSKAGPELGMILKKHSFPFENFLSDTSTFKIEATVTDNGKERVLKIHNDLAPEIKSARLYYNSTNFKLTKAEIEWWKDGQGVESIADKQYWLSVIHYRHEQKKRFDIPGEMKKIISIEGGLITLTEQFKDHELTTINDESF